MRPEDRYLQKRGRQWHYVRRVPSGLQHLDARGTIRVTLKTTNLEIARSRRDALEQADDEHWACLEAMANAGEGHLADIKTKEILTRRYRAANARAVARGFAYVPIEQLAQEASLQDLLERVQEFARSDSGGRQASVAAEAEALLGAAPAPPVLLSEAFDIYCEEIAVGELLSKSPNQVRLWTKTKRRAVAYFAEVVGDKPIAEITRDDALKFYNWWASRLKPKRGGQARRPNTANRDIGNLRQLYDRYFKHIGDESRTNPFRNLNFKEATKSDVPPFPDAWVRERILVPDALKGINKEASLIAYALIETGCRPSEIANLVPGDICLDADVPHIRIRPREDREIKTQSSIREIPLVGVSLEAMKRAPNGFPHYRDRNDLLSASLMKAFRNRGLMPTDSHVIYSFRHSFEKRMLEAGLDYGLRCLLMGHSTSRPAYGDGGSLAYRQTELLKIVHPFPDNLFS